MMMHTFDIRVALVGYVSVGKSTVLNALLGDKFSEVALKRTTAGVNLFRVKQPPKGKSTEEQEYEYLGDDTEIEKAEDVLKEISADNKELRSSDSVQEKNFDIQVSYPICEMRKDTQLVLIDIPGINEAESSKKYKDYVQSNWKSFDCVVVVMDATEGVNTEEQVDLLKFVNTNNKTLKDIPTIVLGNKMDDLEDEDTIHLIEETRSKTIEIFGNVNCDYIPSGTEANPKSSNSTVGELITTAFIPLSAKNAFTYMKAACLDDLDELNDPKFTDLVNKIGNDEYGRKWKKMEHHDRIANVKKILKDNSELDERLAGTNFNSFITVLSSLLGGDERQRDILSAQLEIALETLRSGPIGEKPLSEYIFEAFQKCNTIGQLDVTGLQTTFWKVYDDLEKEAFKSAFAEQVDPSILERPFVELQKYYELCLLLEWNEQSVKAKESMKKIVRWQLSSLLETFHKWSFVECFKMWGGKDKYDYGLRRSVMVGVGWTVPKSITWKNISPTEWIVILNSLSLVWNERRFIEDFGPNKVALQGLLMSLHGRFESVCGIWLDGRADLSADKRTDYCFTHYREELQNKDGKLTARIKIPDSLVDPSHWGFLAWKYIAFCDKYPSNLAASLEPEPMSREVVVQNPAQTPEEPPQVTSGVLQHIAYGYDSDSS